MPKKPEYYHPRGAAKKPSGWARMKANNPDAYSSTPYNRTWQKLRKMTLAREPLCRACMAEGRITPAEHVDHIIPLRQGGTNADANLQPLCEKCHARKTATEATRAETRTNTTRKQGGDTPSET